MKYIANAFSLQMLDLSALATIMRRYLLGALMLLSTLCTYAEKKTEYTQNGTEFVASPSGKADKETKTGCTWTDKDGKKYDIYMSSKGRCYIYRVSKKTGKPYKYYLPKEVDAKVAEQMKK